MAVALSAVGPGWRGSSRPGGGRAEESWSGQWGPGPGPGPARSRRTHCAVTPARQDPQVVHFAVHLQPGVRRQERVRTCRLGPEHWASPHHCPHRALANTYASLGPPWLRSKTCRGLRYQRKDWMIFAPCGGPVAKRVRGGGLRWGQAQGEGLGSRPNKGDGVETGLDSPQDPWERWGRSLIWNLEQLWVLGEGAGILTPCLPPGSVERGGCAYLVAPTLGVHKHQQGLHEGGWGGSDDEGFPAALLGNTARKERLLQVLVDPIPMLSRTPGCPPCTTSGSELWWAWPQRGNSQV